MCGQMYMRILMLWKLFVAVLLAVVALSSLNLPFVKPDSRPAPDPLLASILIEQGLNLNRC